MNKVADTRADVDAGTDSAGDAHEHHLYDSEGEDLGAALGVVALGAAVLCVAGFALATILLRV